MKLWRTGRSQAAVALLSVALVAITTGCGTEQAGQQSKIQLEIGTWGNFGYKTLIRDYEAAHPDIDIVERVADYKDHHTALAAALDSGDHVADIVGIDENYAVQFRNRHQDFHNLLDYGAGALAAQWLPWKWQQMLAEDGKYQIGLGTDVGGLAMCYRPDLFRAAGLPVDRNQVAALWPTWDQYIGTGQKFAAADLPAKWTDSATNIFNQVLAQQPVGYFDEQEHLVLGTDSGVRRAWDTAAAVVATGLSAKYVPFNHQWTAALQGGRFATLTCPAWALGWIQQNAPAARGMWDVARVPGGAGNWGGTWLAVPKGTQHPAEAYELARWLTAPEQQLRIFQETGNLPSQPALYDDPAIKRYTNPFFLDAPVGEIFPAAAQEKAPQYLGLRNSDVRNVFESQLTRYETGEFPAETAWTNAVAEARLLTGQ